MRTDTTRPASAWLALVSFTSLAVLLTGCASLSPPSRAQPAALSPSVTNAPSSAVAAPMSAAPAQAATAAAAAQTERSAALASYAERLRNLQAAELSAELNRLANSTAPQEQLQSALALAQTQQLPELIRAQEAVAKVLGNPSEEAKVWHPLARLLAVRLSEERRLEDLLDKQNQQLKDLQRRLEQTTERLEALKAIERSLVSRPTPVAPTASTPSTNPPAGRVRSLPRNSATQP